VNAAVPAICGLVSVGELASTNDPDPVSSVTAAAKFALVGLVKNVATPVPSPDIAVDIGILVMVLFEPLIVLLVRVAVPLLVTNPPPVLMVDANAVGTPAPNAPPLTLGITTGFVNMILTPAFKLLSAALAASVLFVILVTGI
jgi:hypothetical protein